MGKRRGESTTDPDSVVKVMISTDNHLGYLEKDPVRGDDSFRSFEEVLQLAKANSVDMVLLGGDLFHDNKPSRRTIVRTMQILRKMCFGYDDVRLAVRSDPSAVNYMNECYAVSLPVFIIHGNHDDPTGAAGLEALSALDLLAEANLVTYFGRVDSAKKIEVAPILLQKGATKVALYGLGNIRDELLYDTWSRQRKVRWLSPAEDDDQDAPGTLTAPPEEGGNENESDGSDPGFVRKSAAARQAARRWFNLFVLHQNRLTRGSSRGIAETLLPPWLDYVVWGHEHDSIPELKMSKPAIVQPGSTVATSLSLGESRQKHAILLEIYKGALKHKPIPLRTVRNFEFADVSLSEQPGLNPLKPEGVQKFLEDKINEMIERQEALFDVNRAAIENGTAPLDGGGFLYPPNEFYLKQLTRITRQPLIRLRVEISGGWDALNAQRFGQAYVGRSACSADMLHFYRQRRSTTSRLFLTGHVDGPAKNESLDPDEYAEELRSEMEGDMRADDGTEKACQIPRLVQYYLYHKKAGGTGLKFLELDKLTAAVDEFVQKSEKGAIPEYVERFLKMQQERTLNEKKKTGKPWDEQAIVERFQHEAIEAANRVLLADAENGGDVTGGTGDMRKSADEAAMDMDVGLEKEEDMMVPAPKSLVRNVEENLDEIHALLSQNPKLAALSAAAAANAEVNVGDDDEIVPAEPKPKATRGRGSRRGRGATVSRRTSTASAARPPRQSTVNFGRRAAPSSIVVDDEDDDDIQDESDRQAEEAAATAAAVVGRRQNASTRPTRRAAQVAPQTIEISDEDYEPDVSPAPRRKRKASTPAAGSSGRARARTRRESSEPTGSARRTAFGNRARKRRTTPTVDLDEESGDDAM